MEGWYVAKIQVQKESGLKTFLNECGVDSFYPKIMQKTVAAGN